MKKGTAESYKVVRLYYSLRRPRTMARGMTLEEAQAWCNDPETSSETATSAKARRHTAAYGKWFDGYDKE